jgi:hypothetical protein
MLWVPSMSGVMNELFVYYNLWEGYMRRYMYASFGGIGVCCVCEGEGDGVGVVLCHALGILAIRCHFWQVCMLGYVTLICLGFGGGFT